MLSAFDASCRIISAIGLDGLGLIMVRDEAAEPGEGHTGVSATFSATGGLPLSLHVKNTAAAIAAIKNMLIRFLMLQT
jgi:hypothetical protein